MSAYMHFVIPMILIALKRVGQSFSHGQMKPHIFVPLEHFQMNSKFYFPRFIEYNEKWIAKPSRAVFLS